MSRNKNNLLECGVDENNCTRILDDSDVDKIAEEVKVICTNESDEYR